MGGWALPARENVLSVDQGLHASVVTEMCDLGERGASYPKPRMEKKISEQATGKRVLRQSIVGQHLGSRMLLPNCSVVWLGIETHRKEEAVFWVLRKHPPQRFPPIAWVFFCKMERSDKGDLTAPGGVTGL